MNKQMLSMPNFTEDNLRAILQALPALIWLKDADGVYLACNERFEQFFGALEKPGAEYYIPIFLNFRHHAAMLEEGNCSQRGRTLIHNSSLTYPVCLSPNTYYLFALQSVDLGRGM